MLRPVFFMAKATVIIDKPRKLCFNVWAMEKISEKYGSVTKANELMNLQKDPKQAINTILGMINIMIMAEILRHNLAVKQGIETGDVEEEFTTSLDDQKLLWRMSDFKRVKVAIVEAMNEGYAADYEEEDAGEEEDLVLKELDNEKNVQKAAEQ